MCVRGWQLRLGVAAIIVVCGEAVVGGPLMQRSHHKCTHACPRPTFAIRLVYSMHVRALFRVLLLPVPIFAIALRTMRHPMMIRWGI